MAVALRSPVPAASLVVGPLISHWQRAYAYVPRIVCLKSPRTDNFTGRLTAGAALDFGSALWALEGREPGAAIPRRAFRPQWPRRSWLSAVLEPT